MSLLAHVRSDSVAAVKRGDALSSGTLRYLIAQIQNRSIEKRGAGETGELTDEEVLDVLKKEVKRRRESIELFTKGNRPELAAKEAQELAVLEAYLPPQLDGAAVEAVVDKLIARGGGDFSTLMREAMQELRGKADGKVVADIVRRKLG